MKWFHNIKSNSIITTALVAAVVGTTAGIVGQLFSAAYINPMTYGPGALGNQQPIVPELKPIKKFVGIEQDFQVAQTLDAIRPSLVTIYSKKSDQTSQTYVAKDARSSGVIVTADGWLMTNAAAVTGAKADQLVVADSVRTYAVEKVVVDTMSQIAFLKIKASNLPVANFGDSSQMRAGQLVVIAYHGDNVLVPLLTSTYAPTAGDVVTTDHFAYTWQIQFASADALIGAPVANMDGETVGIITDQTATSLTVRPINQLRFAMSEALRGTTVDYSATGLSYIDLAHATLRTADNKRTKGALVVDIAKNSPALKAGFKVNDVVITVNEQPVDEQHALSDILLQYKSGVMINVDVMRGDTSVSIPLTLGSQTK